MNKHVDHSLEDDCIIKAFMAHLSELINFCGSRCWCPVAPKEPQNREALSISSNLHFLHDNQQERRLIAGDQRNEQAGRECRW